MSPPPGGGGGGGGVCKKEEARTGWCYRCVDGSIGGWGGSASALWRAFASYERTCGTACASVSSGSGIREISTPRLQAWWGFKEDALSSLSLRRVVVTLGGLGCVKCYTRLTGTKWENDASLKGRVGDKIRSPCTNWLRLSGDRWATTFVTDA